MRPMPSTAKARGHPAARRCRSRRRTVWPPGPRPARRVLHYNVYSKEVDPSPSLFHFSNSDYRQNQKMPTGILPYSSGSIGRIGGIRRPDIAPLYDHFGTGTDWDAMEATETARSSNSSCESARTIGSSPRRTESPPHLRTFLLRWWLGAMRDWPSSPSCSTSTTRASINKWPVSSV